MNTMRLVGKIGEKLSINRIKESTDKFVTVKMKQKIRHLLLEKM